MAREGKRGGPPLYIGLAGVLRNSHDKVIITHDSKSCFKLVFASHTYKKKKKENSKRHAPHVAVAGKI